jgi:hypothetical protein
MEAVSLTYNLTPIAGGSTILRFMDGTAEKQYNWSKQTLTISGSGQIPPGMGLIDFTKALTLQLGTTKAITGSLTDVTTNLPPHRTDLGYVPLTYSLIDGFFELFNGTNTSDVYRCEYYPTFIGFFDVPNESQTMDQTLGFSWSLTGVEA